MNIKLEVSINSCDYYVKQIKVMDNGLEFLLNTFHFSYKGHKSPDESDIIYQIDDELIIYDKIEFIKLNLAQSINFKKQIEKNKIREIKNAKLLLKSKGYYVDHLWHINDVKDSPYSNEKYFNCSDDKAYNILNDALEQEGIYESINDSIRLIVQWEKNNN